MSDAQQKNIAEDLSKKLNAVADRLSDQTISLALRAKEAREFLDWHTKDVSESWLLWNEQSKLVLESIRQSRVAIEFESKQLLSACADVRKFFLSDDHKVEIERLRDFIQLAKELRELKADGTLDKLADTILKLS